MKNSPVPAPSWQESNLQNDDPLGWNPYVIIPLIIVCIAILFISCNKILNQLLCGLTTVNFPGNRVRTRHLNLNDLQDTSSLQFESRGLESTVLHSLPMTQFKKKLKEEEESSECAICLGDFEYGDWLKHLPVCCHVFHVSCIDTWFQMHSSCPICRSYVCDLSKDYSISMNSLIETLRREDFFRQTEQHYQNLRSEILQNNAPLPREHVSSAN